MASVTSEGSEKDTGGRGEDVEMATEEDTEWNGRQKRTLPKYPPGRKIPRTLLSSSGQASPHPYPHEGIDWKCACKVLQNVEGAYEHTKNCPRAEQTIVINMDPREVVTMTATRFDMTRLFNRASAKVMRSFLSSQPFASRTSGPFSW